MRAVSNRSVLCGKPTEDGTPCERRVAQKGESCGVDHRPGKQEVDRGQRVGELQPAVHSASFATADEVLAAESGSMDPVPELAVPPTVSEEPTETSDHDCYDFVVHGFDPAGPLGDFYTCGRCGELLQVG